jgi:hypothetical protein
MTEDTVASLWARLVAAIADHAPELAAGLHPPASADDLAWLRTQRLPEDWVSLYACNDGEGAVFGDWHWMRVCGPDSVQGEVAELSQPGRLPIAKDFSGELLLVEVPPGERPGRLWELTDAGAEIVAEDARDWLMRLLADIEDGTWVPEDPPDEHDAPEVARLEASVGHLGDWAVGEERSPPALSEHQLWLVRLHPRFAGTVLDIDPGRVLVFAVEGELPADRQVRIRAVELTRPAGTAVAARVVARGEAAREVLVAEGFPAGARLSVQVSVVEVEPSSRDPIAAAARLHEQGRWAAAAAAWRDAGETGRYVHCLAGLGRFAEAIDALELDVPPELGSEVLLAAGHPDLAEQLTREEGLSPFVRVRALAGVGQHAAALEQLEGLQDDAARWWRAEVLELAERPDEAAAELLALADAPGVHEHDRAVARLRARQLQDRGGLSAEPTTVALTDEVMPLRDVDVQGDSAIVRVALTPEVAARGRAVDVFLPQGQGPVTLRLPPGAGHGARLTLPGQGPDGGALTVEVAITLPEGWVPDPTGRHGSLAFDKWTVIVEVPTRAQEREAGATIPVATHAGVVEVAIPPGARPGDTTVVEGAGLEGPGDRRGDLVVRWV